MVLDIESFRASDDVRLCFYHGKPRDSLLDVVPVFFVHGFASDSEISWIDTGMVRTLMDSGREVFAVDVRGHGLSDRPHESAFYGETRMSRDLSELWDLLRLDRVDLVGHSMGGVVALIAGSSDDRIRQLVLSAVGRYQLDYDGGPLPHRDAAGFAAALSADDPAGITDPGMRQFRQEIDESGNDRLALAAHLRVFYADRFAFDQITASTLVIAGDQDALSPEPHLLAEALPDARAMTVPGDHAGAKTTAAFIAVVVSFLNQEDGT